MKKIQAPFFCVNPKGYLFGSELLELAKAADELFVTQAAVSHQIMRI